MAPQISGGAVVVDHTAFAVADIDPHGQQVERALGEALGVVAQQCLQGWQGGGLCGESLHGVRSGGRDTADPRSEEHTSELQSLMRISYAVFCLKKKTPRTPPTH